MSASPVQLSAVEEGKNLRIRFPTVVDQAVSNQLSIESKSWLLSPCEVLIFDFSGVTEIKNQSYRAFVNLHQLLSKTTIKHCSVNLDAKIAHQLSADGLHNVFNPIVGRSPLPQVTAVDSKNPFDLVLVNSFCAATKKTFEIQAQTTVNIHKPKLVRLSEKNNDYPVGIVGIMNLSTDKFRGSLTLVFSAEVFLKIYERMIGEKHDTISSDIEDAAGEILNIIYGAAKTELNQIPGYNLVPILPTVLSGDKLIVRQHPNHTIIQLPFETDLGTFFVEIAVEKPAAVAA